MELLIIKTQNQYIRIKDEDYHLVNMDKASVFPMKRYDEVQAHAQILMEKGYETVVIKKLVITEEEI